MDHTPLLYIGKFRFHMLGRLLVYVIYFLGKERIPRLSEKIFHETPYQKTCRG